MPQSIQDIVVSVLAKILNRSPQEIVEDEGHYAAYHWDDGFQYSYGDSVDWRGGTFDGDDDVDYAFWERSDFDGTRSIVHDESFEFDELEDGPLKSLLEACGGHFYLPQLGQLMRAGHIDFEYPMLYGKIRSGDSLLDVATHLFLLHRPLSDNERDSSYQVDEQWSSMIAEIQPKALREHLGLFFQDANVARSLGAFYNDRASWNLVHGLEPIARWSIGEGQGIFCIARVLNDEIPPLPELLIA